MAHLEISKRGVALFSLVLSLSSIFSQPAAARGGLPTIGGGTVVTCDTTIRNFSLSAGGTRAKNQIGLPDAGMIVFAQAMFRPCGVNDSITFQYFDGVSGVEIPVPFGMDVRSIGIDLLEKVHVTNLELNHPYFVTVTTRNSRGEFLQSQTLRIVTQPKL